MTFPNGADVATRPREAIDPKAILDGAQVNTTVEEEGVRIPEERLDTVGLPPEQTCQKDAACATQPGSGQPAARKPRKK